MMRRLTIVLLFLSAAAAVFADDATVLPARYGRFRVIPVYSFAPGVFDTDGDYAAYEENEGDQKVFSLGFALEYGVTDWITAAVQWVPGWVAWSDVDLAFPNFAGQTVDELNANGVTDLKLGAKLQIIGEQAPIKNSLFRVAAIPGFKIPLPGADAKEQFGNWKKGGPVTVANPDKHVFGIGGAVSVDVLPADWFSVNVYSEAIFYPLKGKLRDYSSVPLLRVAAAAAGAQQDPDAAVASVLDNEVSFGYDLKLEFEPAVSFPIGREGLRFNAGLPFTFDTSPGTSIEDLLEDPESDYSFTLNPYASVFLGILPLPLELQLGYSLPVAGKNTDATHSLILQVKAFFKI
jgi:hypothetical protein